MTMALRWRKINARRDHRWAKGRLSDYLEEDLSERQKQRLEGHEGICPQCQHAIRTLKRLLKALPRLREREERGEASVADRTTRAVMERIEKEPSPPDKSA